MTGSCRLLALTALLVAGAPLRVSAQCPDGSLPPCRVARPALDTARYLILPFAHREGSQSSLLDGADCAEYLSESFGRWSDVRLADRTRTFDALERRGARPVGEPHVAPAAERLAQVLGAVRSVQQRRPAPLAMYKRQDHVTSGVERGARQAAGGQGAIGTLRAHPERRTRGQQRCEDEQPAAWSHSIPTPSANGRSALAISPAVCHRSSRCFASARASTGESALGTSRRRLRMSGGFWCWCMSSTAAALTDENGGRPAMASNSTTPSE